jgi:hypothetical protein
LLPKLELGFSVSFSNLQSVFLPEIRANVKKSFLGGGGFLDGLSHQKKNVFQAERFKQAYTQQQSQALKQQI